MSTEQERIVELENENAKLESQLGIIARTSDEHYNSLLVVEGRYKDLKNKHFRMKVEIQVLNKAILRRNKRFVKSREKVKQLEKQTRIDALIIEGKKHAISELQNKLFNMTPLQNQEA